MDCKSAGDAMLLYADKKIKPAKASALAKHLLTCESCKEYFMAFEEMSEAALSEEFKMEEAPAGFTESVMKKVGRLPVCEPRYANLPDILIRVFWGLSAVIIGAALFLMYNTDASAAFIAAYPRLEGFARYINALGVSLTQAFDLSASALINLGTENALDIQSGFLALFFVALLAIVLFVLQRGEHRHGTHLKV
jgi:hypothetical protein